jgi:hypothetical protein|eukprot:COSAG01_NODE_26771_length_703_cov_32.612583_1_plen_58_part_00
MRSGLHDQLSSRRWFSDVCIYAAVIDVAHADTSAYTHADTNAYADTNADESPHDASW